MRRWSDRGQTEPFAAIAAVLAVSAGLVVYAGALDDAVPETPDRRVAEEVLDRVERTLRTAGVVEPSGFPGVVDAAPDGWHANVTLRSRGERWSAGPAPPTTSSGTVSNADRATRRVGVRLDPMRIRPGRLRVVIWR